MGIVKDIRSSLKDIEFTLEKGDMLFLYTDGITESQNENLELWGIDGMVRCIEKNHDKEIDEIREIIIREALAWCNGKQADDMSIIAVKRK